MTFDAQEPDTYPLEIIRRLRAEVEDLKSALRTAARNDKTSYDHHEARPWDGRLASEVETGASIWLTPREIARHALKEPNLATLCDPELQLGKRA